MSLSEVLSHNITKENLPALLEYSIRKDPSDFKNYPEIYKTKEVTQLAVELDYNNLEYAKEEYIKDSYVETIIKFRNNAIRHIPVSKWNLVREYLDKNFTLSIMSCLPHELRTEYSCKAIEYIIEKKPKYDCYDYDLIVIDYEHISMTNRELLIELVRHLPDYHYRVSSYLTDEELEKYCLNSLYEDYIKYNKNWDRITYNTIPNRILEMLRKNYPKELKYYPRIKKDSLWNKFIEWLF